MPHATEQEIVSKGLDTKQADLFTLQDMLEPEPEPRATRRIDVRLASA